MIAPVGTYPAPSASRPPAPTRTLWSVQWMRAAAALMVVFGHSQSAVATLTQHAGAAFTRSAILPWGAGVDLFFVISGFIMVHASRRLFAQPGARGAFLARRLVRIVPLYWLATTLFLIVLAAARLKGGAALPGPGAIAASYLFVPFDTHGDARAFPVFDLGWTLNYEMLFYALFAAAVAWPRRRAVAGVAIVLLALVAVGTVLPAAASAPWVWTRPILLDFGVGMLVGIAAAEGVVLPRLVRLVLAGGGIAALVLDPMQVFNGPLGTTVANAWPRVAFAGLPAALVLAGAVLGAEPRLHRALAPLAMIGDASYSLYLFHPFALILTEKLAQKSALVRGVDGALLVIATVAVALLCALVVHHRIEGPMTRWLNDRVTHPRVPPPLAAGASTS